MEIDPAATAWLLACTALVLLMTPGLAIFYGGMVRSTGVLNMIMMASSRSPSSRSRGCSPATPGIRPGRRAA